MKHLAIFASGSGTNAQKLIEYFNYMENGAVRMEPSSKVEVVICNKPEAYVLARAKGLGVDSVVLNREELTENPCRLFELLEQYSIDYIILAGYLLKIPMELISKYKNRIINIHPSLLPAYGGKGMYGHHVHEAVVAAGEKESGITIHLVDEKYDTGQILFQTKCTVGPTDTPEDLAEKIHHLEQTWFPRVVDEYIADAASLLE